MKDITDLKDLYYNMTLPNGSTLNPTTPLVDVFVYGTLKVGGSLSRGLDQYRIKVKEATARGVLYRGVRYPMFTKSACATDIVHGEMHRYPKAVLHILDMIEGFNEKNKRGSLFVREKIPVYVEHAVPVHIYTYVWKRPLEPQHYPIYNGRFKENDSLVGFELSTINEDQETGDLT